MYWRRRAVALLVLSLVVLAALAERGGGPHQADNPRAATGPSTSTKANHSPRRREHRREEAAIDKILTYTTVFRKGRPFKREVALTFDDGPGPYTPSILRILGHTHTPATFFTVGSMITYFYDSLRKESRRGYAIGNHTEDHVHMDELGTEEQLAQLDEQSAEVTRHTKLDRERLFRPPYGSFDKTTLRLLHQRRTLMVLWSVDTEDYTQPGVQAIVHAALRGAKPGAIILLHDAGGDRSQTVAALPKIIRGLRRRHLRPVTVPRLAADDPPRRGEELPSEIGGS